MSLIKTNNRRRLFPLWRNSDFNNLLDPDFFNTDFYEEDGLMPALNVIEHEKDFEVEFAAPGFSKEDFKVTVEGDVLNVYGKKEEKKEEKDSDYTIKEFNYNSFKRSLKLPNTVNAEKDVKATYKNGILKLSLQKEEKAKEHREKTIEIS
ncbi:Hsp20/alpha crystallin family protein [Aegicerativicinus sediminis]|uniref:Hsp20/alpha crystallin family protein n=1 Tax=Aegicerativicinus sediminis TaxID=2893202 RepID=UPI001E340312|nr:Hsp20/alpha crystallin family protein [Aegicerativicinus sediminis]